jgi:hypothetical protein
MWCAIQDAPWRHGREILVLALGVVASLTVIALG